MITPQQVVEHFGTVAKTAVFFKVTPQAVYLWIENGKLPRERELELMLHVPEKFMSAKDRKPAAVSAGEQGGAAESATEEEEAT